MKSGLDAIPFRQSKVQLLNHEIQISKIWNSTFCHYFSICICCQLQLCSQEPAAANDKIQKLAGSGVSNFQSLDMMVGINFTATNFVTLLHASTVPTVHSFLFLGHIVLGIKDS